MVYGKAIVTYMDFWHYDRRERHDVSEMQARLKCTINAPRLDGSRELREFIPHIYSIQNIFVGRNWNETTKKSLFGNTLHGNARARWNTCAATLNENGNVRTLDEALRAFVTDYAPTHQNARYEIIAYLRTAKKPDKMTVSDFLAAMHNMNNATVWFPGEANVLNELEFKYAFHDAMPDNWKHMFKKANIGKKSKISSSLCCPRTLELLKPNLKKETTTSVSIVTKRKTIIVNLLQ